MSATVGALTGPLSVRYDQIQARLLPWWAVLHNVPGWLYYLVDGWSELNHHEPVKATNQAGTGRGTLFTNFTAIRPNGVLHGYSNGDGIFIYPGLNQVCRRGPQPSPGVFRSMATATYVCAWHTPLSSRPYILRCGWRTCAPA